MNEIEGSNMPIQNLKLIQAVQELHSDEPQKRYNAVLFLARYPETDEYLEIHDAVWELTEDPNERIQNAAGIAGCMILARNTEPRRSHPVPDFLREWDQS